MSACALKRIPFLALFAALAAALLFAVPMAQAVVSSGTVAGASGADLVAGTADADYNITFSTAGTDATTITITFPSGYDLTGGTPAIRRKLDATFTAPGGQSDRSPSILGGPWEVTAVTQATRAVQPDRAPSLVVRSMGTSIAPFGALGNTVVCATTVTCRERLGAAMVTGRRDAVQSSGRSTMRTVPSIGPRVPFMTVSAMLASASQRSRVPENRRRTPTGASRSRRVASMKRRH